jgi:hypothetical protein
MGVTNVNTPTLLYLPQHFLYFFPLPQGLFSRLVYILHGHKLRFFEDVIPAKAGIQ